jgi:hypothetical protein
MPFGFRRKKKEPKKLVDRMQGRWFMGGVRKDVETVIHELKIKPDDASIQNALRDVDVHARVKIMTFSPDRQRRYKVLARDIIVLAGEITGISHNAWRKAKNPEGDTLQQLTGERRPGAGVKYPPRFMQAIGEFKQKVQEFNEV